MHELGLIGGTFDRFHIGHKKLITTALKKCQRLEIWILSDSIAKSKNFNIGVFPISEKSWKDLGDWSEYSKNTNNFGQA